MIDDVSVGLRKKLFDLLEKYEDILPLLREYLDKLIECPYDIHYKSMIRNILSSRRKPIQILTWFYEENGGIFGHKEKEDPKKESPTFEEDNALSDLEKLEKVLG